MTNYSKYNVIYRLQKWIDSVPGQTFLNYGYSWGASVVILGALFKLTHLPGANFMLFFGMGTEVIVFFLSAFDRPFDKTDDGRELPTRLSFDEDEEGSMENGEDEESIGTQHVGGQSHSISFDGEEGGSRSAGTAAPAAGGEQPASAAMPTAQQVAMAMLSSQRAEVELAQQQSPELVEAQTSYVDALKSLTEMLGKVKEQSERLTRDSEEMENLNRTLTGITKIYEMQLKGASQQVGTIDQINEQTRKMAQQIADLNAVYARMIEAMTVNMRVAAPGAGVPQQEQQNI